MTELSQQPEVLRYEIPWPSFWLAGLFYLILINVSFAQAKSVQNVLVILSSDVGPYRVFADTLKQNAEKALAPGVDIRTIRVRDLNQQSNRDFFKHADVIVTAGDISTAYTTVENQKAKQIATLITLDSMNKLNSKRNKSNKIDCAVVIDQPIQRQFKVIKQILPDIKSLGMITGSYSNDQISEIRKSAAKYNINLYTENASGNMHGTIKNLARQQVDGILALPDPEVYNSNSARNILISSYHYNLPVLAYSSSFVKAGALIGVFSSPDEMAKQVIQIINSPGNCQSEKIIYPNHYTVEINPQVAKSLDINLHTTNQRLTFTH